MTDGSPEPVVTVERAARLFSIKRHEFDRRPRQLRAVDDVSLTIAPGECLALVGESGSGKSTLARLVLGLMPLTSGRVTVTGVDVQVASARELRALRRRAQIVFQDPYSSLDPRQSIESIVGEGLRGRSRAERRAAVHRVLDRVGLPPEFGRRFPHQLSGGQRQRVSIARALAVEPTFLVLDEPVSALDVSMQSQILNLLRELQDDLGLTYLFISHDLGVVRHVADRVAVMYLGKVIELGATEDVFEDPQHPYTQVLLSAMPSLDPKHRRERLKPRGELTSPIDPPDQCRFATRCFRAQEPCFAGHPPLGVGGTPEHPAACLYPGRDPDLRLVPSHASAARKERT